MAELDKNKDKLQTPATEERVAKAFDWLMVLQGNVRNIGK